MPKPIKKRIQKAEIQQEDIQETLSRLAQSARERQTHIIIGAVALLAVILLAVGVRFYNKNATEKAAIVEAEAFMLLSGTNTPPGLTEKDRLEQALVKFREADSIRPTAFRQYHVATTLYDLQRYDETLETLEKVSNEHSSNLRFIPIVKLKKAQTYKRMGKLEEALETLNDFNFLAGNTLKDVAMMETAGILEMLGRDEEAQGYYNLLLKDHPNSQFAPVANSKIIQPEAESQEPAGGESGSQPLTIDLN